MYKNKIYISVSKLLSETDDLPKEGENKDKEEKVDTILYTNFSPVKNKAACKGISEGCRVFFACAKKNPFGNYCTFIKECYTPKCRMAFNCELCLNIKYQF